MEKAASLKELNVLLVGSNSSQKYLVGNIILGRQAFEPRDEMCCSERAEGQACGRRVTLVKAPGWLRGYDYCNTPELFKTEAILSVTPGLHAFILVINAELPFKREYRRATQEHMQSFFGDEVWNHTIVVFSHRHQLGHNTIEDYIRKEGGSLQTLLKACGNRYHVLHENGADNKEKVKELFEKIDLMVAENRCYEAVSTLIQNAELRRKQVDEDAEEMRLQSQQQRQKLRSLLMEPPLTLRILLVGWVFSGKSASGNSILGSDAFRAGDRTVKASKQRGTVAGREVVVVDTPGWWKFFPAMFTSPPLKSEILEGVSLCSPSPNVILLTVPLDTSFTDEQRRVTEGNMRLLGKRVWRHVIVVFTFGNTLQNKTIEQHIESEGKSLRWLIEKCGNRYHVLNNMIKSDDQVTELLEKMEEMVAGNQCFYLNPYPEADVPQPEEGRSDTSTVNTDEKTTNKITEHLNVKWDRTNWENHHSARSMDTKPTNVSDVDQNPEGSDDDEDDQCKTRWHEVESEDDEGSGPLNRGEWRTLLEREWIRREVAMEQASWTFYRPDSGVMSEPDRHQQHESQQKVQKWLNIQQTASGYGTASSVTSDYEEEQHTEMETTTQDNWITL